MTIPMYIVDTSSLIELNKHNPMDVYPGVWERIDFIIKQHRLLAPREVFNEISLGDDLLLEWSRDRQEMFREPTGYQVGIVREILSEFPSILKRNSEFDADPWIVALAIEMINNPQKTLIDTQWYVVTEEKLRGGRVRIPFICENWGIRYIEIIEMIRMEGWTFHYIDPFQSV